MPSPCHSSAAGCLHHIASIQSKLQSQYLELIPIVAYHCLCAGSAFSPCQQCLPHIAPARPGCISKGGGPAGFSAPQVTTDICHSGTGEVSPNPKKSQQNRNLGKSFLSAQTTSVLVRAGRKPVWVQQFLNKCDSLPMNEILTRKLQPD